jgi:hypothetical protein
VEVDAGAWAELRDEDGDGPEHLIEESFVLERYGQVLSLLYLP